MDCEAASRYFLPSAKAGVWLTLQRLLFVAVCFWRLFTTVCRLCWHTLRIFTRVFTIDTCASTRCRDGVRFVLCPCTIPRLQVMGGLSYIRSAYMLRFVRLQFYCFPLAGLPVPRACYMIPVC